MNATAWVRARFVKKFRNNVRCELCPHYCFLEPGESGKCGVRKNVKGTLITLVYAKPCSVAVDPIEKKPLYHFHPGQKTYSIATVGCNLNCKYCQNFEISQAKPEEDGVIKKPREVVKEAEKNNTFIISYTYTEPTVFYEYVYDIAKLSRKKEMKNILVTNGFINPEPLKELLSLIDAANVDLKAIDDKFYGEVCNGKIEPVLSAIRIMKEKKIWIEITNLIVPGLNDKEEDIKKLVKWIRDNLGKNVPVHFSAFYPCFKLLTLHATPKEKLVMARKIAIDEGLNYVYTGNIADESGSSTICPNCKNVVILRRVFSIIENKIRQGKCIYCGEKIAGVWD